MSVLDHVVYLINTSTKVSCEGGDISKKDKLGVCPYKLSLLYETRTQIPKVDYYLSNLDYESLLELITLMHLYSDHNEPSGKTWITTAYQLTKQYFSKYSKREIVITLVGLRGSYLHKFRRAFSFRGKNKRT